MQYRGGWALDVDELYGMAGGIDVVQTYDDYPVIVMMQFEDLGFCAKGESAAFVTDYDLTIGGSFPHNTTGGQLSVGQAGAAGGHLGVVETIRQVPGTAATTQVEGARLGLRRGYSRGRRHMSIQRPGLSGKNPLLCTTMPPPAGRSRAAQGLVQAAALGQFALHQCPECRTVSYPPRYACPKCLCGNLVVALVPNGGTVLSLTTIRISGEPYFRRLVPACQALIALYCVPTIVAKARPDCQTGMRVSASLHLDKAGQPVLYARPESDNACSDTNPHWRELVADPLHRRCLIADGRNPVPLTHHVNILEMKGESDRLGQSKACQDKP